MRIMKIQQLLSKNQRGASLPMVLAVVTLGVGGLAYTITDLLPKMQKEKTRVEATINYRVFMASLNDYLVHALRERWCFNVSESGETDLLLSDACSDGKPMEEIVTYRGNLERLLWSNKNVEAYPTSITEARKDNRIMAINYIRYHSSPKLTNKLLTVDKILLPNGTMNLRLSRDTLDDMNDQHPLYTMTRGIRECVNSVDIEISQLRIKGNMGKGDAQKIKVAIVPNINPLKIRCHSIRTAHSTSFYTLFPRRLHTFSLIKYDNLDAGLNNEFHGPVYVAGNITLPQATGSSSTMLPNEPLRPRCLTPGNGEKTSIFYNTVTLGIFNSGDSSRVFRPGQITQKNGSPYTFAERGHPYASKQDCYPGFRGFLGGIHLDATEDKGFYNLFDHTGTTSADMNVLQSCINETKYQTTPSLHRESKLAYKKELNTSTEARVRVALTKFNRFKPGSLPAIVGRPRDRSLLRSDFLKFEVPRPADGVSSYGTLFVSPIGEDFDLGERDNFSGTIGGPSQIAISIYLDRLGFRKDESPTKPGTLEGMLSALDNADRNSYDDVVPSSHVLYSTKTYQDYFKAAKDLRDLCETRVSAQCAALKYPASSVSCAGVISPPTIMHVCDYGDELNAFTLERAKLRSYFVDLQTVVNDPTGATNRPRLTIRLEDQSKMVGAASKDILNQKLLNLSVTPGWKLFFPLLKKKLENNLGLQLNFQAFHFGIERRSISLHLVDEVNFQVALKPLDPDITDYTLHDSWRTADQNRVVSLPDPREIVHLDCPNGMGLADWDNDMSGSSSFSWNYANTPAGAVVDTNDHSTLPQIVFAEDLQEGHLPSLTKSIVDECIVKSTRNVVYGFYVCKKLTIEPRTNPLHMIGTFIVKELSQQTDAQVSWYSVWDAKAGDFILTDLNSGNPQCTLSTIVSKTFLDYLTDGSLPSRLRNCTALNLVNNGPNNFTWTTVDPDIGIANAGDTMTSQKANRIQKWIIKEESRVEVIR